MLAAVCAVGVRHSRSGTCPRRPGTVRVLLDLLGDLAGRRAVERDLADLGSAKLGLAGEGHNGPVAALAFLQIIADGVKVLDGALNAVGDKHGLYLAADLVLSQDLLVEVIDHDLGLEANGMVVALDKASQLLLGFLRIELRVVCHRLGQLVMAVHRRVVGQHVQVVQHVFGYAPDVVGRSGRWCASLLPIA